MKTPSDSFLDSCTKEQLLKIADHYKIEISDKRLKDIIKSILRANVYDMNVLPAAAGAAGVVKNAAGLSSPVGQSSIALSFEQQRELLLLQMEHEKLKHKVQVEKELALENMKFDIEQARITLEHEKLSLIREGRLSQGASQGPGGDSSIVGHSFDQVGNLRLVPLFNERDPETFFSLFERLADARGWPDADRTVLLQCVLTGKAQEAYSALSVTDSMSYAKVKTAVLKVYEMVPEAQRFKNGKREDKQSYLEFSRDLLNAFNRWPWAVGNEG